MSCRDVILTLDYLQITFKGEIILADMVSCNSVEWAQDEFGDIDLGHKGRTKRLVKISSSMGADPSQAMSNCCGANGAQSVSDLFLNSAVSFSAIMSHHAEKTVERIPDGERIIVVQDTTPLNFSSHKALEGIGYITTDSRVKGFLLHTGMAMDFNGIPYGILSWSLWARKDEDYGKKKTRSQRPFEEKESYRWYKTVEDVESATPDELPVLVEGDRESDIYELFARPRRDNIDLLVRVSHFNRYVIFNKKRMKLREAIKSVPVAGIKSVEIKAKPGRSARTAQLQVKFLKVILPPSITGESKVNVEVSCIYAFEENDEVKDPVRWGLLTTLPVENFDEASDLLDKYSLRWSIETFHRNLKSICKVEKLQFRSLESLLPAIAMTCIMGWRITHLAMFSRFRGDEKAENVADPFEIAALKAWNETKWGRIKPIDTVCDFVREVAVLGGFLARKCDGHPGAKHIYRGLMKLEPLALGYRAAFERCRREALESACQVELESRLNFGKSSYDGIRMN